MKKLLVCAAIFAFASNASAEEITADIFENGKNVGTVTMDASKFPAYAEGLKAKGMKAVARAPQKSDDAQKAMKDSIENKKAEARAQAGEMKKTAAERKAANIALHEKWKAEAAARKAGN